MGTKKTKITHQRARCIGCGSCAIYAKDRWKMDTEDGKANLIDSVQKGDFFIAEVDEHELTENIKAATACPVNIIRIDDSAK